MTENKELILKVLVGSHAHNLAGPDSDFDYRGVYVLPTIEILSLGFNYKGSHWLEGEKEDQTAWEIAHFLLLATKCNPSILECFVAPREKLDNSEDEWRGHDFGKELVELFPSLWSPKQAYDAFVGYGLNQRKKLLDNHLGRWHKYGTAYIRTLVNLISLLQTGTFSLVVEEGPTRDFIIKVKNKEKTPGEIVDQAEELTTIAHIELDRYLRGDKKQEQDLVKVNSFLLKVRQQFWGG